MTFFEQPQPRARRRIILPEEPAAIQPPPDPAIAEFIPIRHVTRGRFDERGGPFRYRFAQRWGSGGAACFVLMQPLLANDDADDGATIKCRNLAMRYGYGGMIIVYACANTHPGALLGGETLCGEDNPSYLILAACASDRVIFAYGDPPSPALADVGKEAAQLILKQTNRLGFIFGLTDEGNPRHPLSLPFDAPLISWSPSKRKRIKIS